MKMPDQNPASPRGEHQVPAPGGPGYGRPGYGYDAPPQAAGDDGENEQFDPRQFIGLFFSYWWLILLFVLLGVGSAAAYCILGTPKYRAQCRYEIVDEKILRFGTFSTEETMTRQMDRQVMLLQSDVLKSQVRNKLKSAFESRLHDLDTKVVVMRGRPGTVLNITVDAVNEDYAVKFLDELIVAYEQMREMDEIRANERAVRQLMMEKTRLESELANARQGLVDFQKKHKISEVAQKRKYESLFVDRLMTRRNMLRIERMMIGTQLRALDTANAPTVQDVLALTLETHALATELGLVETLAPVETASDGSGAAGDGDTTSGPTRRPLPGVADTGAWESQERQLSSLEAMYNNNLKQYRSSHPAMLELEQEIESAKRNIEFERAIAKRRLEARFDALKIQEDALSDLSTQGGDPSDQLSIADASTFENLKAEVGNYRALCSTVGNRIIDVSAKSSDSLIKRLIAKPQSVGQVWPKTMLIMVAGLAGSLAVGIGLSLLLFFSDTKFMDVMAIEQKLGLPFISGIPRWERVIKDLDPDTFVIMDKSKPNAVSEAYRSLRISLESHIGEEKGYALLLTSADAGEGKSVTSANLGVAFAWTGKRVLLVDADLRRPNLHNALGEKNPERGLTQLLLGEVGSWREILQHSKYENVDFLPAGKFVYEASELCSQSRLLELKEDWARDYDIIVLDSAPVGRIVDTAMIARGCDGILLVSLHGKSSLPAIRHALRRLEGTNVLGFCLNAIDMPHGRGHQYGGYYGYKWRYGLYSYYYYYSSSLYGYDAYYGPGEPRDDADAGGEGMGEDEEPVAGVD